LRVALVAVGLLVATCIAGSRVVLGVHFPGDVAAGSLLGAAIGSWGARVHLRKRAPKAAPTTSPEPAPRRPLLDDGRSPKTGRFARGACRRRPC
jgi:membrane-associated phospholipid phosphatase